jgi:hypothetical protein
MSSSGHVDDSPSQAITARLAHPFTDGGTDAGSSAAAGVMAAGATDAFASSGPPEVPGHEILDELGRGGMGVVFRARQVSLGRIVALKMISAPAADDESLARFRAEAEAVARLTHPNIVQIYEVGRAGGAGAGGRPYLSLEFAPGGSLSKAIAGRPQNDRRAAETVAALARAVQHAHDRGILHRDLKPANVLLAGDGTPKLTDFGLAKCLDGGGGDLRTRTGEIVGSPGYMGPEQATGQTNLFGPATDVYGLGTILYEMLTGRPPFRGSSPIETLRQVIDRDPDPPRRHNPAVDRDLQNICLKCLEKEPEHRYPSAAALADDLERWSRGDSVMASGTNVLERLDRALGRSHQAAAFARLADMSFWFAGALAAGHAATFALVRAEAGEAALTATRMGMYAVMGAVFLLFHRNRSVAASAAERQFWSTWLGYFIAAALASVCVKIMIPDLTAAKRELVRYSLWSLLLGMGFFSLGASFWGWCYAFGVGFMGLAVVASFELDYAPLIFGGGVAGCLSAIGLYLRRLAREADAGDASGSGFGSAFKVPSGPGSGTGTASKPPGA